MIILFESKQAIDRQLLKNIYQDHSLSRKFLVYLLPEVPVAYYQLPSVQAAVEAERANAKHCLHLWGNELNIPETCQILVTGKKSQLVAQLEKKFMPDAIIEVKSTQPNKQICVNLMDWLRYHWSDNYRAWAYS